MTTSTPRHHRRLRRVRRILARAVRAGRLAAELIEPARAVQNRRLAQLYVIAAVCFVFGRLDEAMGYADAGQAAIATSTVRRGAVRVHRLGTAVPTWRRVSPNAGSICAVT